MFNLKTRNTKNAIFACMGAAPKE